MQGLALIRSVPPASLRDSGPGAPPVAPAGFLPKEHGSWSLVLEPLALGLLVAPSFAGTALATAAFAGFLARRPLKAAQAPGFTPARCAARQTVVMFSALVVAGMFEVVVSAGWAPLWPLALAAPLGGLFAYLDAQSESRAALAEMAGSAAFALLPAALATLAGWAPVPALALTGLALARNVPAVLLVRTYVRARKGAAVTLLPSLAAGTAALGLVGALGAGRLVPPAAIWLGAILWLRGGWLLSPFRPAWTARRIGLLEAGLGAIQVGVLAAAYAGFYP